jgi:phosphate:Na+ symporter
MIAIQQNQAEILTTLLAGIGLFFTGIRFLGDHLRQLADHRMRVLLARATQNDRSAAAMGFLGGSVMQSMNAVVFVLVSLVTARVIDVRRALPAINFANLGSSVLVILAAFDPKIPILLLLFTTGVLLHGERDQSPRIRQATRALLGLGLLGLGLVFIKTSGHSLGELPWMSNLLSASERSLVIAFMVGAVLAFAVQSASSVTLVTMALSGSGIIDFSHSLLVVYGAGIGGGASTWLLGATMKGLGKQLVLYQFALKASGLVLLLPLAMIEFLGHVPLVAAALDSLPATLSLKIAFAYLLFQIACDLVMHFVHGPVHRLLERTAPPTAAEEISEPQYIYHDAQQDPPSAVLLTSKEQERLLQLLPFYLDSVREEIPAPSRDRRMLHQGASQVAETCHRFLEALLAVQMSEETLEMAVSLKDRNQLLSGLQETVNELAAAVERVRQTAASESEPRVLAGNLVETLHLMLETLAEAAGQSDTELVMTLKALTADRSDLLHDIRRRLLAGGSMDSVVRETVFDALSLFERSLWLMRHFAMRLAPRNT